MIAEGRVTEIENLWWEGESEGAGEGLAWGSAHGSGRGSGRGLAFGSWVFPGDQGNLQHLILEPCGYCVPLQQSQEVDAATSMWSEQGTAWPGTSSRALLLQ